MTPTSRLPRRRWWHRYAVLEQSHTTGENTIASWHRTRGGALTAVAVLNEHYWGSEEREGHYVTDVFDWRALPATHYLVREVEIATSRNSTT